MRQWIRGCSSLGAALLGAVLLALTIGALPAEAASSQCSAGRTVYRDAGLRIQSPRATRTRLIACSRTARRPRAVALPAGVTGVTAARRFGDVVGVLLRTSTPRGRGAAVVAVSRTGTSRVVARIGRDVLQGSSVRQFALAQGSPYLAVLLSSGDLAVLRAQADGTVARWSGARPGETLAANSLGLDVPGKRVTWRVKGGGKRSAPLLPVPGCAIPGREVTRTAEIRVVAPAAGPLYACLIATGRVNQLVVPTYTSPSALPDPLDERSIVVAGAFVAYVASVSTDPDGFFARIQRLDLGRGIVTSIALESDVFGDSAVDAVVLAANGSLAYLERLDGGGGPCPRLPSGARDTPTSTALIAVEGQRRRTLECVTDPPPPSPAADRTPGITGLALAGQTLSWLSLGVPKTATLG